MKELSTIAGIMKRPTALRVLSFFLLFFCCFNSDVSGEATDKIQSGRFLAERKQMVEHQIKRRGVTDERVLEAFMKVERHCFVPKPLIPSAYEDRPLPIGYGQTISQPYIVAFMTEALHLSRTDRVLEIGTGSGYQAAILAELCQHVYTIEILEPLGKRAKKILNELGYKNITIKIGDGYQGWEEYAPYDAVIVTCAPSHVPVPLKEQLKEGGRMIIPVGEGFDQELIFLQKKNQALKQKKTLPVLFVPMVDETGRRH
jgi:protein-L-isoaspartate(D-aspartate) O-methyltransferase